jgi:hypothetical protein
LKGPLCSSAVDGLAGNRFLPRLSNWLLFSLLDVLVRAVVVHVGHSGIAGSLARCMVLLGTPAIALAAAVQAYPLHAPPVSTLLLAV